MQPYDKTTHDGKTVDWLTKYVLLQMELDLGYPLTVVQGSYHAGVGASAGTHDGGGVVDLAPFDWRRKVRVARRRGMWIWHRPRLVRASGEVVWNEHIHGGIVGHKHMSPAAVKQQTNYFNGTNGLVGQARDTFPRPDPIPTPVWPGADAVLTLKTRVEREVYAQKKPVVTLPQPSSGQRVDLVDLSHYNTVTAAGLQAAKSAGVLGVYHKATEGTSWTDSEYRTRRSLNSRTARLRWGAYHFARPAASDGTSQARSFLKFAAVHPGNLPPMLDLEDTGGLGKVALSRWVGDFVAEVKRQTGVEPILYNKFDLTDTFGCELWVARYSNTNLAPRVPAPWKTWTIWQFSDGVFGRPKAVAGLGSIDLNTVKGDPVAVVDSLRVPEKGVKPPVVVKPLPEPPPPVGEVIRHGQVNLQQTDPTVEITAYLDDMTSGMPNFDTIVWNELGGKHATELQNYVRALPDFDSYLPNSTPARGSTAAAVAISWRKDKFEMLEFGSKKTVKGAAHASPDRYSNHVLLRSLATGKQFFVQGTHIPHHYEVGGLPRVKDQIPGQNDRARAAIAGFVADTVALTTLHPLVGSGDLNDDYHAERRLTADQRCPWFPMSMLQGVAQTVVPKGGTDGRRAIDWVWQDGMRVLSCSALPLRTSDHNAVLTVLDLI